MQGRRQSVGHSNERMKAESSPIAATCVAGMERLVPVHLHSSHSLNQEL